MQEWWLFPLVCRCPKSAPPDIVKKKKKRGGEKNPVHAAYDIRYPHSLHIKGQSLISFPLGWIIHPWLCGFGLIHYVPVLLVWVRMVGWFHYV